MSGAAKWRYLQIAAARVDWKQTVVSRQDEGLGSMQCNSHTSPLQGFGEGSYTRQYYAHSGFREF